MAKQETDEAMSRSHQQLKMNISNACVNALKFDSNSNNSFDELISMTSLNHQQQQEGGPHRVKQLNHHLQEISFSSAKAEPKPAKNAAGRANGEVENKSEEGQSNPGSASPPPPPSIGSLPLMSGSHSAPSPTKLPQFYPYTVSSGHVMHRPIPILQKADATLSSLISNLTAASQLVSSSSASSSSSSSPQNLNAEQKSSKSTRAQLSGGAEQLLNFEQNIRNTFKNTAKNSDKQTNSNKTASTCDLNELIKINNQQQLISSLRLSMTNNSPLMFNMGFNNNNNNTNNSSNGLISSFNSNSNPATNVSVIFFYFKASQDLNCD